MELTHKRYFNQHSKYKPAIVLGGVWWTGSCGIPGFFQNPDPEILKNLIPGFPEALKGLHSQAFNPFHWPKQVVLRPLIPALEEHIDRAHSGTIFPCYLSMEIEHRLMT